MSTPLLRGRHKRRSKLDLFDYWSLTLLFSFRYNNLGRLFTFGYVLIPVHHLHLGMFFSFWYTIYIWVCRFFECMGAMLANLHDPYIQRGYRPFVIEDTIITTIKT